MRSRCSLAGIPFQPSVIQGQSRRRSLNQQSTTMPKPTGRTPILTPLSFLLHSLVPRHKIRRRAWATDGCNLLTRPKDNVLPAVHGQTHFRLALLNRLIAVPEAKTIYQTPTTGSLYLFHVRNRDKYTVPRTQHPSNSHTSNDLTAPLPPCCMPIGALLYQQASSRRRTTCRSFRRAGSGRRREPAIGRGIVFQSSFDAATTLQMVDLNRMILGTDVIVLVIFILWISIVI